MVRKKYSIWRQDEKGQSLVEFAIILPILIMLLTVPVDLYRYINTQMALNSALCESLSQLQYKSIKYSTTQDDLKNTIDNCISDKLDKSIYKITTLNIGSEMKNDYDYKLYSSEYAKTATDYWGQFEVRKSNFSYVKVDVQLSYEMSPITIWGQSLLGSSFTVKTPTYSRYIYAYGYTK